MTSPRIEREQWEKGDGFHKFEAFELRNLSRRWEENLKERTELN